jgi:hypothetical protein
MIQVDHDRAGELDGFSGPASPLFRGLTMNLYTSRILLAIRKSPQIQIVIYVTILLLMGNLNALVDVALHPEVSYFDGEHLIVGGLTICVSGALIGLLMLHIRFLSRALNKIQALENLLPICSKCKRIRKPDADPMSMDSWQPVEIFFREKIDSEFTHGICPECAAQLYPEFH